MKLAELKQLENGCPVVINEGHGWWREATFIKAVQVTSFGKITLDDLLEGRIDLNGKKKTEAVVRIIDDDGRKRTEYVNPRNVERR